MCDPNLADFYGRVARIERARAKGCGFEATRTFGRSHYRRPVRQHRPLLRMTMFVFICAFGLKGTILHTIGLQSYDARIARLQTGQEIDKLGAWLMQADPVTVLVAAQISAVQARLNS